LISGGSPSRAHDDPAVRVNDDGGVDSFPPLTCVFADGLLPFAIDVAEEVGVPALAFRTSSACSFLAYLSVPRLLELGELPFPAGGGGLDEPVRGVPGMEGLLRRRDLPVQCRRCTAGARSLDPVLQTAVTATAHTGKARALVFNTTASLEGAALTRIAPHVRDVFAVGPLHAMCPAPTAASLWREDDGCMAWLDGHEDRSVVYVSLGSLTVISQDQLTEFLSGLLAAGYPFLWVLRPDMVGSSSSGGGQDPVAVVQAALDAAGREDDAAAASRVVAWAPQRAVLRHRAVGCFLTHAGWNSVLEAVAEGTPTVCWPFFADQQVNSRFVGAVWCVGLDMKDVCDGDVVARTVREAMESDGIRRAARAMAEQVRRDVADGGSSAVEFERLVRFIKELSTPGVETEHRQNGGGISQG
ncbi:hypothetical protein EJB05_22242, partial [Eragrostis curvula]